MPDMSDYLKKAPFNDWWYWSDVLAKRLRTAGEIYKENDERERATELGGTATRLTKLFGDIAQKGMRAKTEAEKDALKKEEEDAIYEGTNIWRDLLSSLPFVSEHMETFQNVMWRDVDPLKAKTETGEKEKDGKTSGGKAAGGKSPALGGKAMARAVELFWGPDGRFDEGLRSGLPVDGGLPGILMNMLLAEKSNSNRTPTEYKNEKEHAQYYGRDAKNTMKGPGMGGGM